MSFFFYEILLKVIIILLQRQQKKSFSDYQCGCLYFLWCHGVHCWITKNIYSIKLQGVSD